MYIGRLPATKNLHRTLFVTVADHFPIKWATYISTFDIFRTLRGYFDFCLRGYSGMSAKSSKLLKELDIIEPLSGLFGVTAASNNCRSYVDFASPHYKQTWKGSAGSVLFQVNLSSVVPKDSETVNAILCQYIIHKNRYTKFSFITLARQHPKGQKRTLRHFYRKKTFLS